MRRYQAAAAASLLMLSVGACRRSQAGPAQAQGFPPASVQIVRAGLAPLDDATEYVATLKSLHSTTIQPQIDGQIVEIFVKSGDRVNQGARLLQSSKQPVSVGSRERARGAGDTPATSVAQDDL